MCLLLVACCLLQARERVIKKWANKLQLRTHHRANAWRARACPPAPNMFSPPDPISRTQTNIRNNYPGMFEAAWLMSCSSSWLYCQIFLLSHIGGGEEKVWSMVVSEPQTPTS
jgi:hypothetical protein